MRKITIKHLSFFMRWFLRYNAELFYLQNKMPELPENPNEQLAQSLDKKRRASHLKIHEVTKNYGHLCGSCSRCCTEMVERYTDFDQFIHAGVGKPLDNFDRKILNLPVMITNSTKRAFSRLLDKKDGREQKSCRYLGESGCTIPHHKRPILCVSWFCPKYIFGMHPGNLDHLEEPLQEMLCIHRAITETVCSTKS